MNTIRNHERFRPLATYNAERDRGIVHTADWTAKMYALQQEFDLWTTTDCPACGHLPCRCAAMGDLP